MINPPSLLKDFYCHDFSKKEGRGGRLQSDKSAAEGRLLKRKQRLVDDKNIVFFTCDKVFDNEIRFAAVRERIARTLKEIARLIKTQTKRHGKRECRTLARLIIRIAANL